MPSVSETLYFAVVSGDFSAVRRCVAQGANVQFKHPLRAYQTALHESAARNHPECTLFLIEKGASVDEKDSLGATPLHKACYFGQIKCVQVLLSRNSDPRVKDSKGFSALHYCCRSNALTTRDCLNLVFPLVKNQTELVDNDGRTPLHVCGLSGNIACAQLLLESHAQLDVKDDHGRTPLFYAVLTNQVAMVKFLLLEQKANPNSRDLQGQTPIFWSTKLGFKEITEMLLERNASVNWKDDDGRICLHWAASAFDSARMNSSQLSESAFHAQIDLVQTLVKQYRAEVNSGDKAKATPLHSACLVDGPLQCKMVKALLDVGADKDAQDADKRTPVAYAASLGFIESMAVLLEAGAECNVPDLSGKSPLFWACARGHRACVARLIDSGIMLGTKDEEGRTALFWACRYGSLDIVRLLINAGASVHVRDKNGCTCLFWAVLDGHWEVCEFLLSTQHPKLHIRDNGGKTLLHYAAQCCSPTGTSCLRALLKANVDFQGPDSSGMTVLHEAAVKGNDEAVSILIREYGADVFAKTRDGRSARDIAALQSRTTTVDLLYEEEMRRKLLREASTPIVAKTPQPTIVPITPATPSVAGAGVYVNSPSVSFVPSLPQSAPKTPARASSTQVASPATPLAAPTQTPTAKTPGGTLSNTATPSKVALTISPGPPASSSRPPVPLSPMASAAMNASIPSGTRTSEYLSKARAQARLADLMADLDEEPAAAGPSRPMTGASLLPSDTTSLDIPAGDDLTDLSIESDEEDPVAASFTSSLDISKTTRALAMMWLEQVRRHNT
eukprot:ANDGO_07019.mRNA.1 Ankyrin repeat